MRLYPNNCDTPGEYSWRGRYKHHLILIYENFNNQLGHVDSYSFTVSDRINDYFYSSNTEPYIYTTIEKAKNAAITHVQKHKDSMRSLEYASPLLSVPIYENGLNIALALRHDLFCISCGERGLYVQTPAPACDRLHCCTKCSYTAKVTIHNQMPLATIGRLVNAQKRRQE